MVTIEAVVEKGQLFIKKLPFVLFLRVIVPVLQDR